MRFTASKKNIFLNKFKDIFKYSEMRPNAKGAERNCLKISCTGQYPSEAHRPN